MCGISGFVDAKAGIDELRILQKSLGHRGPDAQGHYLEPGVGLAHNRLAIIDLSHDADQPYYFENLILIYNGEIYNYKEIRQELKSKGYHFTTNSDTEVLIKGFHLWGPGVLDKLIGMFAFALYDRVKKELYLCRDRLGVKPLFYYSDRESIFFASELKSLLKIQKSGEIDLLGLQEYLLYGYTVSDHSFFSNIKKVPPGHYLIFAEGSITMHSYWNASEKIQDTFIESEETLTDMLEELLVSSFRYRMISDVPVGIFFSGGIDSTTLVALLSKHHGELNTFTIGFDDKAFDETPFARKVAAYFKTNHTEKILNLAEAKERLNKFYKIYDEPFFDSSGIPTSLVAELAKAHGVKVVLSSEGGDELFAGYPSYERYFQTGKSFMNVPYFIRMPGGKLISETAQFFNGSLSKRVDKFGQLLSSRDWLEFYQTSISSLTKRRAAKVINNFNGLDVHSLETGYSRQLHPIEQFMLWDIKYLIPNDFMVKIDRATMYHGVEAREPFLDHRLIEFSLRLPLHYKIKNGQNKYLLKKVLERYIPAQYFNRPKMGFSIPLFNWFNQDLDSLFETQLAKHKFSKSWPQIDYSWVEQELKIYKQGKASGVQTNMISMWKLVSLMLWADEYLITDGKA